MLHGCSSRARHAIRLCSTVADAVLREYQLGRTPLVVPFEIDAIEARRKFVAWQKGILRLAPGSLLPPSGGWHLQAVLLPFWMFDVQAQVEYTGAVRMPAGWREVGWKRMPHRQYSWQRNDGMLVYASYKYRRDCAQAIAGLWAVKRLQPLHQEDAVRGTCASATRAGGVLQAELAPPTMRQAIAWEFVLRGIHDMECHAAEQQLLVAHGAGQARDVHVRVRVLDHRSRLAFFPCFRISYELGETMNVHGERTTARYEAFVSGTVEGGVAGTRHFSPTRAGGSVILAAAWATAAAPLLGLDPWSVVNVESAFSMLAASSFVGWSARMLPLWLHRAEEERRLRTSDAEFDRVVSMGVGPLDTGSEAQEALRSAAEWRRWEAIGADEPWLEHKRHQWAEELFAAQHKRRFLREQLREKLSSERVREEAEQRREARRRQRWGRSSHHYTTFNHRHQQQPFAGGKDVLGYYRLLGLGAKVFGSVTQQDINLAFRRAALKWHPDHVGAADERGKQIAKEKFQLIRTAYEVLRDPVQRAAYDRHNSPAEL